MSDLPSLLGSSVEVEIGGRRWRFAPLTLQDEADLELELRHRLAPQLAVVDQVRSMLGPMAPAERIELLKWAMGEELRLRRLGPIELAQEFRLPDVDRLLIRYQLRRHHPDVTDEQVGQLTSDFSARKVLALLAEQIKDSIPKDLGPALAAMVAATGRARSAEDAGLRSSAPSPSDTAGP